VTAKTKTKKKKKLLKNLIALPTARNRSFVKKTDVDDAVSFDELENPSHDVNLRGTMLGEKLKLSWEPMKQLMKPIMDKEHRIKMERGNDKANSSEPKKLLVIDDKPVPPPKAVALKDLPKTNLRSEQSSTKQCNLVALLSERSRSLPANLPSFKTKNVRFEHDDESNIIIKHDNNKPPAKKQL
jgi:hypothetical protein